MQRNSFLADLTKFTRDNAIPVKLYAANHSFRGAIPAKFAKFFGHVFFFPTKDITLVYTPNKKKWQSDVTGSVNHDFRRWV
jgi:hypothetical protein